MVLFLFEIDKTIEFFIYSINKYSIFFLIYIFII